MVCPAAGPTETPEDGQVQGESVEAHLLPVHPGLRAVRAVRRRLLLRPLQVLAGLPLPGTYVDTFLYPM